MARDKIQLNSTYRSQEKDIFIICNLYLLSFYLNLIIFFRKLGNHSYNIFEISVPPHRTGDMRLNDPTESKATLSALTALCLHIKCNKSFSNFCPCFCNKSFHYNYFLVFWEGDGRTKVIFRTSPPPWHFRFQGIADFFFMKLVRYYI